MSFSGRSVLPFDNTSPAVDLNTKNEQSLEKVKCDSESHSSKGILPQKAVILQMQDLYKLNNRVANVLLKATPKCDTSSIKIFELIVNAIDPHKPPADRVVRIEKELLYEFLDLRGTAKSNQLKNKIKKFATQLQFDFSNLTDKEREIVNEVITDQEPTLNLMHKNHIVFPATEIFWEDKKSYISIELTKRIIFFLSNLGDGKRYTIYDLVGMSKFESKYSVILYRWLRMEYQIFKYTADEKNVKNKIEISIDDLRALTDTQDLYHRFDGFENRILKIPQEEINEYSTIKFEYRKIKKGRKVIAIQFFVNDNPKNKPVKVERLSPRKTKEERESDTMASAYKAIISDYTDMLAERFFLKKGYKKDMDLLARLNDDLYPLYEQLVQENGTELLETHLDMIQRRVELATSDINDVVAYLIKCVKQSKEKNYTEEYKFRRNRHTYS